MTQNNSVAGFTSNSSSATITVPAGATVVKAFLTWSANTGVFTGDTRRLCSQYSAARGVATMPAGSATGYTTRAVQFKVGSAGIVEVAPQSMLQDPASQATALYYSASADVTSAFASVTTGSEITVSAGNIWTPRRRRLRRRHRPGSPTSSTRPAPAKGSRAPSPTRKSRPASSPATTGRSRAP